MTGSRLATGPELLEDEGFVRDHVRPLLSRRHGRGPTDPELTLTVRRSREDPRGAVAHYVFEGSLHIVAKLYPESAQGRAAYAILDSLWYRGFGSNAPFRVPEPLAYLAEYGVILMRGAPGESLSRLGSFDGETIGDALSRASLWLAALHASPQRVGPREDALHGAFRLEQRVAKAVACRPDLEDFFGRAEEKLTARGEAAIQPRAQVQTHGRFRPEHVFLAPKFVTASNLDRAALADPMKDLGEFIHHLRWEVAREGLKNEAAEESVGAFLREYVRCCPFDLSSLAYHWSYSNLWSLATVACRPEGEDEDWSSSSAYLTEEYELVPHRAAALASRL